MPTPVNNQPGLAPMTMDAAVDILQRSGSPLRIGDGKGGSNENAISRINEVKALQHLLNYHGAWLPENGFGSFGPKTDTAVRDFQRRSGLEPDGIVGRQTIAALVNVAPSRSDLRVEGTFSPNEESRLKAMREQSYPVGSVEVLPLSAPLVASELDCKQRTRVDDIRVFHKAYEHVLEREGGYSNHKADRGGRTNFGITQATLDSYRESTGRGPADVRALDPDTVRLIYLNNYWNAARCPELPPALATLHFDAAVNCGIGGAAGVLRRALGMPPKGGMNDEVLAAIESFGIFERNAQGQPLSGQERLNLLLVRCLEERRDLYLRIIEKRPSQEVFKNGWMARVGSLAREVGVEVDLPNTKKLPSLSAVTEPTPPRYDITEDFFVDWALNGRTSR